MPVPVGAEPPSKRRKLQSPSQISRLEEDISHAATDNLSLNPLLDLLDVALECTGPEETSRAIYALYRVFVLIISTGKLNLSGAAAADDSHPKVVKTWLWDRLNTYTHLLSSLLQHDEKSIRTSALKILFSLQRHLSSATTKSTLAEGKPQFHVNHFRKIVSAVLTLPSDLPATKEVLLHFHQEWTSVHDDIRWFFLREVGTLLQAQVKAKEAGPGKAKGIENKAKENKAQLAENTLFILERLVTFPTESSELNSWWVEEMGSKPPKATRSKSKKAGAAPHNDDDDEEDEDDDDDDDDDQDENGDDDWRKFFDDAPSSKDPKAPRVQGRTHTLTLHQSLHSLPSHRAVFSRAWLLLLPHLNTEQHAVRALSVMHRGVLPYLTRPVMVMDWVGACVDYGRSVGLLALNALYVLMKEYNLDYPSFYTRLYAFLDRDVLHLTHRARFFRLTEIFLGSTHLPLTLLASFIKRLARLSLSAPPAAIVMIIPMTYNLLKRHPGLMVLVHRNSSHRDRVGDGDGEIDADTDPYLPTHPDPLLTDALSSSLWELSSHRTHYHAPVATLAKVFEAAFTRGEYAMEDFLDFGYGTLFDTEANRKIKREPAVASALELGSAKALSASVFGGPTRHVQGNGEEERDVVEQSERLGRSGAGTGAGDVINELWEF